MPNPDIWRHDPRGIGSHDFKKAIDTDEAKAMGIKPRERTANGAFLATLRGAAKIDHTNYIVPIKGRGYTYLITREGAEAVQSNPDVAPNFGKIGRALLDITLSHSQPAEEDS